MFFGTADLDPNTPQGRLLLATAQYRISFIRHGDPNTDRLPSSPEWPRTYPQSTNRAPYGYRGKRGSEKGGEGAGGVSLVLALEDAGGVHLEVGYRGAQCDYWDTLSGGPD